MAEQSLPIPQILIIPKEEPKIRKTTMTKLNLGLPDDNKSKSKAPLHLIISTSGKTRSKNLYQKQLRILRRTLQ